MSISTAILADSPYAYWKLDDASGPAASDSSGNSRPGVYGGTFYLHQTGPEAGTFAAYLQSGTVQSLNHVTFTTKPYSLEIWVAVVSQPSSGIICYIGNGSTSGSGPVFAGGPSFQIFRGGIGNTGAFGFLPDQNWHQYVFTHDGSANWIFYMDGVQVSSGNASANNMNTSTDNYFLGGGSNYRANFAHFAVWNSVLSSARVSAHFSAAGTLQPPAGTFIIQSADLTTITADLAAILAAVQKTFPTTT